MFKQLRFENFKSWQDTGEIKLSPITGFFGTNSSGKSAILQFLLMLKQTMESSDRRQVLHMGNERTYVNLGTIYDIAYDHKIPSAIIFSLEWDFQTPLRVFTPESSEENLFFSNYLGFSSKIELRKERIFVNNFRYKISSNSQSISFAFGDELKESERAISLRLSPIKNYAFPEQTSVAFQNTSFLSDLNLSYEKAFQNIYYLGPLREYPQRIYSWAGGEPQDVGHRGELAIPALLASQNNRINIEKQVAHWLKELGLIDSFRVAAIAETSLYYEVRVKRTPNASEVLITDVGFGVSQILPVLVLCYYAPEYSTIILEQPEIHLHPSVQSGLADVFIDVIKTRNLQIILESHSEHLLRRLQRRIAEEKDGLTNEDMSLYFCNLNSDGSSKLTALELDQFGNIANWPENFFGDEMGDLFAMTEAAMKRQMGED
jgi:predicted ATPase